MKTEQEFLDENKNFDGFIGVFKPISNAKKDRMSEDSIIRVTGDDREIPGYLPMSFYDKIEFNYTSGKTFTDSQVNPFELPHKIFVADDIFQKGAITNSEIDFWKENWICENDIYAILDRIKFDVTSCVDGSGKTRYDEYSMNCQYELAVADENLDYMLSLIARYCEANFDMFDRVQRNASKIPYPYNGIEAKKEFIDSLSRVSISVDIANTENSDEAKYVSIALNELFDSEFLNPKFNNSSELIDFVYQKSISQEENSNPNNKIKKRM